MAKILIAVILILIFTFIVVIGVGSYQTIYNKNPNLNKKIEAKDINYLYDFYLRAKPDINDKLEFGNHNASITFIAVFDVTSDASLYFIQEIYPQLKKEFIDTGKIRYIHKSYLTFDDISNKTDRFKYSAAIECLQKEEDYPVFFSDIKSKGKNSRFLSKQCPDADLANNAVEIENFGTVTEQRFYIGINGFDNTVLDGVPSYKRFYRVIRNNMIVLGD